MKKMMLMVSMLGIVSQNAWGAQHGSRFGKNHDERYDIMIRQRGESGLVLKEFSSKFFENTGNNLIVFGGQGTSIKDNTITLQFQPKNSDVSMQQLLSQSGTRSNLMALVIPINSIGFPANVALSYPKNHPNAPYLNITSVVNTLPHSIYYQEKGSSDIKVVSGIVATERILHHCHTGSYEKARKILGLVGVEQAGFFVDEAKNFISPESYNQLVSAEIAWLDGAKGSLEKLGNFAKITLTDAAGKGADLADKAKKEALNRFQKANKAFTKTVGAWGGVAIGSVLGIVGMWLLFLRKK